MNTKGPKEEQRLLELLDVVGQRSNVSQRYLARHMGVALGLANSYLKRCIRKGFIKIREAPANRYLYYLTPKGFAEKSRLTAEYLSTSFEFYRRAGQSCVEILGECEARGWRRICLCGVSDLAEIAALKALALNFTFVGTYDADAREALFLGRPVWKRLQDARPFDVMVLTELRRSREIHQKVVAELGNERVLVPDILRL